MKINLTCSCLSPSLHQKLTIVGTTLTKYTLAAAITSCLFFSACKKEIAELEATNGNRQPVANAGNDQTIPSPTYTITLDGSGSSDADSNIIDYQWSKIDGPSEVNITNSNAISTEVNNFELGFYHFVLRVTDAGGLFSQDTVEVAVVAHGIACDIDKRPKVQARLVLLGQLTFAKINMVTAVANNKILFAGGSNYGYDDTGIPIRSVDIYDINSNSWSTKDLYEYPTWRLDMGMASTHDKIFIAGGGFWGDDIYTSQVDIYNPEENSWALSSLSEARTAVAGVSAANKVFFAGGYSYNNGNYWSNTVDIYDNATDTWSTSTLSERRGYISAVSARDKVYFAGGVKSDGNFLTSDRVDIYDLLTNSWSTSTLREPLTGLGVVAADNKVYFAGGSSGSGESGTVEIRDVVTGQTTYDCIIPRANLTAVLQNNNIVFFTGSGSDPRNGTHFEIFNLPTKTWYTAELDKSITAAAIISVNNVIYVAGGIVDGVGSDKVWKLKF
jgi:hypothetical protein